MKRTTLALGGLMLLVGVGGYGLWSLQNRPRTYRPRPATKAERAAGELQGMVSKSGRNAASRELALKQFIDRHETESDAGVQDQVGRARLHLGYLAVQKGDPLKARQDFRQTAKEYKGTGVMGADFGGIPDQAEYQAAVCLVAAGKPEVARQDFKRFLAERPLSPLVHAAYRRLERLNGGKPDHEGLLLLQKAIAKQEEHIRRETSVCGPKAIAYMLPLLGKPTKDYRELARLAGTNDQGTSLDGMRKALRSCGVETFGLEVGPADARRLTAPFLILRGDHYLVATRVERSRMSLYDPRDSTESFVPLPKADDPEFRLTVLTTSIPDRS